ncbi:CopG family ribbon-helix-helix protein [Paracraurococcus lichenis]|uniref:Ribbon-helix-helix domain-containing protein n=1 Tax=Paracraurococcus lichenis TaxID=3064888 RepID=A0ABT9DV04_9PROT|nr:ribbon-helix-helix domain-containing protein [Paracraurococcus sp. LOR1-02]MDO9707731.1 ribbon-helix-helix domain-containing protein [Paracraurococcus sp. LOR1-02]
MAEIGTVPVTIRMSPERRDALDDLARRLERDRSELVDEAVAEFIDARLGWAAHLQAGLQEAEAGDIATEVEVAAAFAPRAKRD